MPVIPKAAGITSVISSLYDIHKTALIYSQKEYNKVAGNSVIACSIGNQKANHISYKDAQRKNWTNQNNFFIGIKEAFASVKGYIKGAFDGFIRYIPKLGLAALAIIPSGSKAVANGTKENILKTALHSKKLPYIATMALAGIEIWDYLKNGTGLFERTNYLERK